MNYKSLANQILFPLSHLNVSEITRTVAKNRAVMLLESTKKNDHNAAKRASGQLGSVLYNCNIPRGTITQIRCRLEDALMGREMGL